MSKEGDGSYKISISGDGVKIEKEISADTARLVVNIVMGGQASDAPAGSVSGASIGVGANASPKPQSTTHAGTKLSLREFFNECEASTNQEKITAIAAHMKIYGGKVQFLREEVLTGFRQAGEVAPKNYHRDFSKAVASGWIAEDTGNAGSFYITHTGEKVVQGKFSPDLKKSASRPGAKRRGKKGKASGAGTSA